MMLDDLFAQARDGAHGADSAADIALMARIVADAEAEIAARTPVVEVARGGWLRAMVRSVGGWPSMAGLATAGVTGLAIGLSAPAAISGVALGTSAQATGVESASYALDDLMPSFYDLGTEG
ncbi:hypothetical protein GCM10022404_01230 [Celeribacter arenosi]|uniref:Dihydroorotate dehydrogenase n=2 Tax=Celeribacter arenosi TaxID=792649 RepID=A0ABP7JTY7_9RHOB